MGFGLLFLGYFIAELMSFHSFGYIARLVGYILILIATKKLSSYERAFRYAYLASFLMIANALFATAIGIGGILYNNFIIDAPIFSGVQEVAYNHIDNLFELIFHIILLIAIRKISISAEVDKNAYAAARNAVFYGIYFIMFYISYLPFEFTADYVRYFSFPVILLYVVCLVLNVILIYSCYAKICDEADLDMPRKPSRFDFINKIREESDRRENRAIESTKEYIEKRKRREK